MSLGLAAATLLLLPGFCVSAGPPKTSVSEDQETVLLVWHSDGADPPNCWTSFQIGGCRVTGDRGEFRWTDGVLFRHLDVVNAGDASLPREPRPPGQKWIWFQIQSPTMTPRLAEYEGVYNLTFSYREDSDIFLPPGYLVPNALLDYFPQAANAVPLDASAARRRGCLSWVVSHWSEKLERVTLYNALKDHVPVDLYGDAGKAIPPGKDAVVELLRDYQFYLALENAQHTDYITEKLWNAVLAGTIPVVLGPSRENYERYLPPEAFVHVDDFPTVRDLARYLLKVRDDPVLLETHLGWRRKYSVYRPAKWDEYYCVACEVVRLRRGRTDVVRNLEAWYFS